MQNTAYCKNHKTIHYYFAGTKRFDSEKAGDREVQRTMLELLNQLDGFSSTADIKVRLFCYITVMSLNTMSVCKARKRISKDLVLFYV